MSDITPTQPKTKEIPLSQGKVAIVDAADYEWLMQWKWFAHKSRHTFYAGRNERIDDEKVAYRAMHRVLLRAPVGINVDHRNGDGLDNRRDNLRLASLLENNRNARLRSDNTSGYKGVSWAKRHKKWYAQIGINGKYVHIGHFDTAESAALAYDARARQVHGEFARTNFPLKADQ